MGHTHPGVVITCLTSVQGAHTTPIYTALVNCGNPLSRTHRHALGVSAEAGSHDHDFTLSFASAELGAPNWWEHQHDVVTDSVTNGGAAHSHAIPSPTWTGYCSYVGCNVDVHSHTHSVASANGGGAHNDHDDNGQVTENATEAGGTPEAHVHKIDALNMFYSSNAATHTHALSGAINNAVCKPATPGWTHTHTAPTGNLSNATHYHTITCGNTGIGGEAAAAVLRRLLTGVGL